VHDIGHESANSEKTLFFWSYSFLSPCSFTYDMTHGPGGKNNSNNNSSGAQKIRAGKTTGFFSPWPRTYLI